MASDQYLLGNRVPEANDRLTSLATIFDPVTFRHLEAVGIGPGWRCWEVGAGGPSVTKWLAEQAGREGSVLATDIDVSWLQTDLPSNVTVRTHDVAVDDPPEGPFDLVHARLVLVHVPGRVAALRHMAAVLRPGGWLVIEDFDVSMLTSACVEAITPAQQRANKIRGGFLALLGQRGVDLEYGRKLPRLLRELGLTEVTADAYFPVAQGAALRLEWANTTQVVAGLVAGGFASQQEIDDHLATLEAAELDITTPPLISALGRLP